MAGGMILVPPKSAFKSREELCAFVSYKMRRATEMFTFKCSLYQRELKLYLPEPVPKHRKWIDTFDSESIVTIPISSIEKEEIELFRKHFPEDMDLDSAFPGDLLQRSFKKRISSLLTSLVNKIVFLLVLRHDTWYVHQEARDGLREYLVNNIWPKQPKMRLLYRDHVTTFVDTRIRHFRDSVGRYFRDLQANSKNSEFVSNLIVTCDYKQSELERIISEALDEQRYYLEKESRNDASDSLNGNSETCDDIDTSVESNSPEHGNDSCVDNKIVMRSASEYKNLMQTNKLTLSANFEIDKSRSQSIDSHGNGSGNPLSSTECQNGRADDGDHPLANSLASGDSESRQRPDQPLKKTDTTTYENDLDIINSSCCKIISNYFDKLISSKESGKNAKLALGKEGSTDIAGSRRIAKRSDHKKREQHWKDEKHECTHSGDGVENERFPALRDECKLGGERISRALSNIEQGGTKDIVPNDAGNEREGCPGCEEFGGDRDRDRDRESACSYETKGVNESPNTTEREGVEEARGCGDGRGEKEMSKRRPEDLKRRVEEYKMEQDRGIEGDRDEQDEGGKDQENADEKEGIHSNRPRGGSCKTNKVKPKFSLEHLHDNNEDEDYLEYGNFIAKKRRKEVVFEGNCKPFSLSTSSISSNITLSADSVLSTSSSSFTSNASSRGISANYNDAKSGDSPKEESSCMQSHYSMFQPLPSSVFSLYEQSVRVNQGNPNFNTDDRRPSIVFRNIGGNDNEYPNHIESSALYGNPYSVVYHANSGFPNLVVHPAANLGGTDSTSDVKSSSSDSVDSATNSSGYFPNSISSFGNYKPPFGICSNPIFNGNPFINSHGIVGFVPPFYCVPNYNYLINAFTQGNGSTTVNSTPSIDSNGQYSFYQSPTCLPPSYSSFSNYYSIYPLNSYFSQHGVYSLNTGNPYLNNFTGPGVTQRFRDN